MTGTTGSGATERRPLALVLAAAAAGLLLVLVFAVVPVRSDLSDLLPRGETDTARLLLDELRSGDAASVMLAGIEGAPEAELAALSRRLAGALATVPGVAGVQNGTTLPGRDVLDALFARRYLLSPAVDADAFSVTRLRTDLRTLLDALQSAAFPLVTQYGLADPTGAFTAMLGAWNGAAQVRSVDGVWMSAHGEGPPTAVLLIRTRAAGLDVAAQ